MHNLEESVNNHAFAARLGCDATNLPHALFFFSFSATIFISLNQKAFSAFISSDCIKNQGSRTPKAATSNVQDQHSTCIPAAAASSHPPLQHHICLSTRHYNFEEKYEKRGHLFCNSLLNCFRMMYNEGCTWDLPGAVISFFARKTGCCCCCCCCICWSCCCIGRFQTLLPLEGGGPIFRGGRREPPTAGRCNTSMPKALPPPATRARSNSYRFLL